MGDRHKNYEDPITWTRDIRKTKFDLLGFSESPFSQVSRSIGLTLRSLASLILLFISFSFSIERAWSTAQFLYIIKFYQNVK
jgi:hypothetical protein